jgi:hypothetical protein
MDKLNTVKKREDYVNKITGNFRWDNDGKPLDDVITKLVERIVRLEYKVKDMEKHNG